MATIGQRLLQPESGWKRYDDTYPAIIFYASWGTEVGEWNYNGSGRFSSVPNAKIVFRFSGTRLRVIGGCYEGRSKNTPVFIDEVLSGTMDESQPSGVSQVLVFEVSGLSNDMHLCEILVNGPFLFDAIDIDVTGRLFHPLLEEKTTIESMEIGDVIPCRYQASSGAVGTFSELGTCNMDEIPLVNGTATPNGLFYFIKADKGLLIADRVVQHSISWVIMNAGGIIEGKLITLNGVSVLIRSLTGGVAHANNEDRTEPSLTYKGYGAFPDNEWDKYIVNSDLDGKITPSDNNIWNWSYLITKCKDTPVNGVLRAQDSLVATNTYRTIRSQNNIGARELITLAFSSSNFVGSNQGFRPVLQYIEPYGSTKQKTLWY